MVALNRVKLGQTSRKLVTIRGPQYVRVYQTYEYLEIPPGVEADLIEVSAFQNDGFGPPGWIVKGFEVPPENASHHEGPYR